MKKRRNVGQRKCLRMLVSLVLTLFMVARLMPAIQMESFAVENSHYIDTVGALGAEQACQNHVLGVFNGCQACLNDKGDLHICENNFPSLDFRRGVATGRVLEIEPRRGNIVYTATENSGLTEREQAALADPGFIEFVEGCKKAAGAEYIPLSAARFIGGITNDYDYGTSQYAVIKVNYGNIRGIEFFNQAEHISFKDAGINRVNLGNNKKLKMLHLSRNHIREIDLNTNVELRELDVVGNYLGKLDVSAAVNLERLWCGYNDLHEIDVSKNVNLLLLEIGRNGWHAYKGDGLMTYRNEGKSLAYSYGNNEIASVDLSKNANLKGFSARGVGLEHLTLSCPMLQWIDVSNNKLSEFNLDNMSRDFIFLNVEGNRIPKLDLSSATGISEILNLALWNQNITLESVGGSVDLSKYFSRNEMSKITNISVPLDYATGIVTLSDGVTQFTYEYNVDFARQFYVGYDSESGKYIYEYRPQYLSVTVNVVPGSGWKQRPDGWIYFKDGVVLKGWQHIHGVWYYLGESGIMQTGWQQIGGTWYYFHSSGAMAASEWVNGYWLNSNGAWTYKPIGSWKQSGRRWWFGDTSGWYAKSCTIKINGVYYTFDSAGWLI